MIEPSFSIAVARSKWLLSYLIIIHALMLVTIGSLLDGVWLILLVTLILSTSFIYYCQRFQWLKSSRALVNVVRDAKHRWQIMYSNDRYQENLVLKHCVVTPMLVMLYFSGPRRWTTKSVIIIADAVDAELFRQLRVYCRAPKLFQ